MQSGIIGKVEYTPRGYVESLGRLILTIFFVLFSLDYQDTCALIFAQ